MKIYTKVGDGGQTSLVEGTKVSKSDLRIDSYGTVDELNSFVGMLISEMQKEPKIHNETHHLTTLQNWLFDLGSQLACSDPKMATKLPPLKTDSIQSVEEWIDGIDGELQPLRNFILPGGHPAAAVAHVCRTVTRRAERLCVSLDQQTSIQVPAVPFLNRLSDYFFVLSRWINHRTLQQEVEWKPSSPQK